MKNGKITTLKDYLDEKYSISAKYYLSSSLLCCVKRFAEIFRDTDAIIDFAFISATYDYQMKVSHLINRFNFIINFLKNNDLELSDLTTDNHFKRLRDSILKTFKSFHRFDPDMRDFQNLLRVLANLNLTEIAEDCYDPAKPEPVESVIKGILRAIHNSTEFRSRSFIPKPTSRSTKKRVNLFLRWVVRAEYPDLGIWRFIDPAHLYISLDSGVSRVFQRITGITVKENWNGVLKITNYFRRINPSDPSKYDYVLSRPAILDICKKRVEESDCDVCLLSEMCLTGRNRFTKIEIPIEHEENKTKHDYIRDLFKKKNPWGAPCVREKYLNGKADLVCYLPCMENPKIVIIIEVKVTLTFNGIKQLMGYLRTATKKWRQRECRGVLVCMDIADDQKQKIFEISEYHKIDIYKLDKNNFIKLL